MRRKSRREELMYSWHCQYYFHFSSSRKEVHAGLHRVIQDLQLDYFACFLICISEDRSPNLPSSEQGHLDFLRCQQATTDVFGR